jgi:hypothetical protein
MFYNGTRSLLILKKNNKKRISLFFVVLCVFPPPFFQLLSMTVHQYDKWLCKTVHDLTTLVSIALLQFRSTNCIKAPGLFQSKNSDFLGIRWSLLLIDCFVRIDQTPMKQHTLHYSISICEVKLKIPMETHELLGRYFFFSMNLRFFFHSQIFP